MSEAALKAEQSTGVELDPDVIPIPVGWRLIVRPVQFEEKSSGGILLPDSTQDANKHLTYVGQVLAMGDLCYTEKRYAVGDREPKAWCKVGDWVLYGQYQGQKIKVQAGNNVEVELVVLNDDEIRCRVPDPYKVRAFI